MSDDLSKEERQYIAEELRLELGAKIDGQHKNLISRCPSCDKESKFGVYVGKYEYKFGKAHCFSCGISFNSLFSLATYLGREDLLPIDTIDLDDETFTPIVLSGAEDDELEEAELVEVEIPESKRKFYHKYVSGRGWNEDDYDIFPVYISDYFKLRDYVILPIVEDEVVVGYVARHTWSKRKLEKQNKEAKRDGSFQLRRYNNSTENPFAQLVYNIDNVIEGVTTTVIMTEGVFNAIAINRALALYDNDKVVVVSTFGKKISITQAYKIQMKGVKRVILAFDKDAGKQIKHYSTWLGAYFDVLIADYEDESMDFDDMTEGEVVDIFDHNLTTAREYFYNGVQIEKLKC